LQKKGVFKNIYDFLRIYIFRVVSREGREGGEGWEKGTAKYAKYANKNFQPEPFNSTADERG